MIPPHRNDSSQGLSILDTKICVEDFDLSERDDPPKRERSTGQSDLFTACAVDDYSIINNLLNDTTLAESRPPLKRAKSDNAYSPINQTPVLAAPGAFENCWRDSSDSICFDEELRKDAFVNITTILKNDDVCLPHIKVEESPDRIFSDKGLQEQFIRDIVNNPPVPEPTDDELYDHPADDVLYDPPPVFIKSEPESILPEASYHLNLLSDTSSDDDIYSVDFTSDCEYDPPPPEMPPIQSSRPRRSARASARKIVATPTTPYPSVTAVAACTPCTSKSFAVASQLSGPAVVVKTEPGVAAAKAEKSGAENDPRPYKCKVPGCRNTIGFKKPKHFYEHMRTVHSDGVMCPVPGCSARLSKASNVKRHLNEQHTLSASARAMYISAVK